MESRQTTEALKGRSVNVYISQDLIEHHKVMWAVPRPAVFPSPRGAMHPFLQLGDRAGACPVH